MHIVPIHPQSISIFHDMLTLPKYLSRPLDAGKASRVFRTRETFSTAEIRATMTPARREIHSLFGSIAGLLPQDGDLLRPSC